MNQKGDFEQENQVLVKGKDHTWCSHDERAYSQLSIDPWITSYSPIFAKIWSLKKVAPKHAVQWGMVQLQNKALDTLL